MSEDLSYVTEELSKISIKFTQVKIQQTLSTINIKSGDEDKYAWVTERRHAEAPSTILCGIPFHLI